MQRGPIVAFELRQVADNTSSSSMSGLQQPILTVLLVGPAGVGKRSLAAAIRKQVTTGELLRIHFRTAEVLPLPTDPAHASELDYGQRKGPVVMDMLPVASPARNVDVQKSSFRYDLVLIVVDMSNKKSWVDCQKSLRYLEPSWFLGHCALVITKVDQAAHYAFDREEIEDFMSNFYDLPVFWTNLHDPSELNDVALSTLRLLSVATGFYFAGAEQTTRKGVLKSFLPSTVSYSLTRTPEFYHTVSTVIHRQDLEADEIEHES